MKRLFFLFFLIILMQSENLFSQVPTLGNRNVADTTSVNPGTTKVILSGKTKYTDYKIISYEKDTSYIDTTLTIQKHYRNNFLRKDNFELLAFHNIGQPFNNLAYQFDNLDATPGFGYRAKQFFYQDVEDVNYYHVPTPTSEIMFLTTLEQGQFLESFFTANLSPKFNFYVGYRGLRSLGKYRRSLISQGNFKTAFRYETKEGQYTLRGHIMTQDLLSEESGGLTPESLEAFITNDENFTDRARLDVNLTATESSYEGGRLHFEHDFKLLATKDSLGGRNFTNLKIGHSFTSEGRFYEFRQDNPDTDFFGATEITGNVADKVRHDFLRNRVYLEFNSKYILGTFRVKSDLINYSYGYGRIINQRSGITTRKIEGSAASFGADWKAKVKGFELDATGQIVPGNGRLSGTNLKGRLSYKKDSLFTVKASLAVNSTAPNFNFLLHQSTYEQYNWENNFSNIRTQDLGFQFDSRWINANVNFTNIENFTYFGEDSRPNQAQENVTYLKVKASREFRYRKFALDNTLMYQNVSSGSSIFRVPEFVTRNTAYYSDYWFEGNPIYVQIGATFKFFTDYKANAYDPLLAEFRLQNAQDIGFSTVDFFFNAQVRRTRIYFRVENAFSNFGDRNYFSAPNYPYRDFVVRFGLVWNWFI